MRDRLTSAGHPAELVASLEEVERAWAARAIPLVIVGTPRDGGSAIEACARLAGTARTLPRVLWGTSTEPGADRTELARIADDVVFREEGIEVLVQRVACVAAWSARLRAAEARATWMAQVAALAHVSAPRAAATDWLRAVGPQILALSGVRGFQVRLQPDASAPSTSDTVVALGLPASAPLAAVREAIGAGCAVTTALGTDRLVTLPVGTGARGALTLRLAPACAAEQDALDAVAAQLGHQLDVLHLLSALKLRQAGLERGCVERQRLISRLGARVERLAEARDACIAFLSHELRNPLAVVVGHCELLEEDLLPVAHRTRAVETIRRQATRMENMVDHLLDRYRRPPGPGSEASRGDLVSIAHEMVDAYLPMAARRRQRIVLGAKGEAPIEGDLAALREVVGNLLDNGLRNSPDGGAVSVDVTVADDEVTLQVTDEGPPYPSNPLNADAAGRGVGLRASVNIVGDHGGVVRTGASDGCGRLSFTLPRRLGTLRSRRVVLVGGEPGRLDAFSELLAGVWDPTCCSSPAEALAQLRHATPTAILVDGTVQDDAMFELLHQVKADAELGAVPVVFLAAPGRVAAERAHVLGALEVLSEPVEGGALLAALQNVARAGAAAAASLVGRTLDALTGCDTAASLDARLPHLLALARAASHPLPVVSVDVVDLKGFNRTHGWSHGDQLLGWIAGELRHRAGAGDILARAGSDEFLLVQPGRSLEHAITIVSEIREYFSRARPRIGVARVVVHARADAFDAAGLRGDTVKDLLVRAHTARRGIDGAR